MILGLFSSLSAQSLGLRADSLNQNLTSNYSPTCLSLD